MKDEQQIRLEALKFAASQRIAGSKLIEEAKRFEAYISTGQDAQSSPVTEGKAPSAAKPAIVASDAPSDDGQASDEPEENKPKRRRSQRGATPVQS